MSVVAPAPAAPSRPRRAAPATETAPKRRQNRRRPAALARPRAGRSPVAPGVLWVLADRRPAGRHRGAERGRASQLDLGQQDRGPGGGAALAERRAALARRPAIGLGPHQRRRGPLRHDLGAAAAQRLPASAPAEACAEGIRPRAPARRPTSRAAKRRREQAVRPAVAADHVRVRSRLRGRDRARAVRADPAGQRPGRPRPRPAELDHRGAHQPRPDPRRDRQDAGRRRAREGPDGLPVQGAGPRPGRLLHRPEAGLPAQAQEGVQARGASCWRAG